MGADLKPCPFCGVALTPNTNQADLYVHRYGTHYMHQNNGCLLDGNEITPSEVEQWNRRPDGAALDVVAQERERCARIADDEARIREEAGRKHPEDSEARARCWAGARAATNVAKGIRSGEVAAGVIVDAPLEQWRPMETAPTDGTMVRLLVNYSGDGCHPLEDAEIAQTIGGNTDGNTGDNEGWRFAGWSWEQDCFTEGQGKPLGWLPMAPVSDGVNASEGGPTK